MKLWLMNYEWIHVQLLLLMIESCCCWFDTLGIINCELVMRMVMLLLKMVVVKIGFD